MQSINDLFTAALGIQAPWSVQEVRFQPQANEIHFDLVCGAKRLTCPACEAENQPIHDRRQHTWQHLHFFQYRAYLHADVPRVRCMACGKTSQVQVPWARPESGFTLLFEAFALTLARTMPVHRAAQLLGITDGRAWRVLIAHIEQARALESHAEVTQAGVDEIHLGRLGWLTVFHDSESHRVLFTTPGKNAATFDAFVEDLQAHGGDPQSIETVSMDMSTAFQSGARRTLPQAKLCFDPFHLVKLAGEALNKVRRAELKHQPELKGIRWATLKSSKDWTLEQIQDMHWLQRSGLKTARAWRLKERLRDIVALARQGQPVELLLRAWISWARRCRLAPFKALGATFLTHLEGIVNALQNGISNGPAESINATIRAAIARACGFRSMRELSCIVYLIGGKLSHLPQSPFLTQEATPRC